MGETDDDNEKGKDGSKEDPICSERTYHDKDDVNKKIMVKTNYIQSSQD